VARIHCFYPQGRIEAEQVAELKELFDADGRNIILDLQDMRLADRDTVRFLSGTLTVTRNSIEF
jgi:hypothetical protein